LLRLESFSDIFKVPTCQGVPSIDFLFSCIFPFPPKYSIIHKKNIFFLINNIDITRSKNFIFYDDYYPKKNAFLMVN